jgi:hypothetical protein
MTEILALLSVDVLIQVELQTQLFKLPVLPQDIREQGAASAEFRLRHPEAPDESATAPF